MLNVELEPSAIDQAEVVRTDKHKKILYDPLEAVS